MHPIIKHIKENANILGLRTQKITNHSISIWSSRYLGISLQIKIKKEKFFEFNFHNRTSSFEYAGERTDLHDIISIAFSAFIRMLDICSTAFIDIPNPVAMIDGEIYARYIVPIQVNPDLINIDTLDKEKVTRLVSALVMFEHIFWNSFNGCPCDECRKRLKTKYEYRYEGINPKKIEKITSVFGINNNISYCERTLPTWLYFQDFSKKISCIKSQELTIFLRELVDSSKIINGINGELRLSGSLKNYLNYKVKKRIENYFLKLKDRKPELILFENKILAIGDEYILTFDEACGFDEYKLEKEKIRERHKKEFDLLFKPSNLIWVDKIDEELFEEMIKDILEREPNVQRVRKTSNTHERDGGADLIAEFNVPKKNFEMKIEGEDIFKKIRVVVQCKAYRNGVGKSDVLDIRDTIDYRNYEGYFLAISSYTKKSLSDYLDKLRTDGKIWIDWWTRSEIEEKLKQHEDLIIKYNSLMKIKND